MNEVIVEYDYTAKESDELTIKKGDIIKDVVKKPGGWWEGVLKDKKGMFPDNFVRPLDKDGVVFRNSKDVCRIKQCRVVFSYNQDHEDELNLKVGKFDCIFDFYVDFNSMQPAVQSQFNTNCNS
ncbi:unnamed protein product [Diabrotica balteata]|uniref:SH3 domain-containing protein n=1 Tax=Diabrotica balteata TaxID=107213 RepID=A0A9N9TCH8_DIABA|nr:unnamed protein product [Diabrotica balteata]